MEGAVEKAFGHELHLSGPLIDIYLEQIGRSIMKKLGKKHLTGQIKPLKEFIPQPIFLNMVRLFAAYGCDVHHVYAKKKSKVGKKKSRRLEENPKKIFIWVEKTSSAKKLFSPERFDSTNYLVKRMFARKILAATKKRELIYDGKAVVAITTETPICFEYDFKANILEVSFVIQQYNSDGVAVDSTVQAPVYDDVLLSLPCLLLENLSAFPILLLLIFLLEPAT